MNHALQNKNEGYRASHAGAGYGKHYEETYRRGYYADLWTRIESPLLEKLFVQCAAEGRRACLDFACGTGRITALAERYFEECVGVDVSDTMLEVARTKCARAQLVRRDITVEPIGTAFDVITAFRFFLNAEQPLRRAGLRALRSALAPGGRIIINVHVNRTSLLGIAYRFRNWTRQRHIANTLGLEELAEMLREENLHIESVVHYGLLPRVGWRFEWLPRLLMTPIEKVFRSVSLIPRNLAQCFIVVCSHAPSRSGNSGS
jgi:SAM-dependent methyltransferase